MRATDRKDKRPTKKKCAATILYSCPLTTTYLCCVIAYVHWWYGCGFIQMYWPRANAARVLISKIGLLISGHLFINKLQIYTFMLQIDQFHFRKHSLSPTCFNRNDALSVESRWISIRGPYRCGSCPNGVRFPSGMAIGIFCVEAEFQFGRNDKFQCWWCGVCARFGDCAILFGFVLNRSSIHVSRLGIPQNKPKLIGSVWWLNASMAGINAVTAARY